MKAGTVVICPTGQAGTITHVGAPGDTQVLLCNGDVWTGDLNRLRIPQGPEDLAAAPLNVDRIPERRRAKDPYEVD